MGYPPAASMLAVQGSSLEEGQLALGMEYLAKYVRSAVKDKDLAVIGPADETISRISDPVSEGVLFKASQKRVFKCAAAPDGAIYRSESGIPENIHTV